MRGVYTAQYEISALTAGKTVLYGVAPSTMCLEILEALLLNLDVETVEQMSVGLFKVTTIGSPAGTSVTPEKNEDGDAASAATFLGDLSAEPTTYHSNPLDKQGVTNLSGYEFIPLPELRPIISPSKAFGLKLLSSISAIKACAIIKYREIGG